MFLVISYISIAVQFVGSTFFALLTGYIQAVHVGGYLNRTTNSWHWEHGTSISNDSSVWARDTFLIGDEPNNLYNEEYCSCVYDLGGWLLGDLPCGHLQPYVCQSYVTI